MKLDRVAAPECPKCGCNATTLRGAGERFGAPWAKFECDFCHHAFHLGRNPAPPGMEEVINGVTYNPVRCRCPKCNAVNPPVVSTPSGRYRWHKCRSCGQTFKSVEAG